MNPRRPTILGLPLFQDEIGRLNGFQHYFDSNQTQSENPDTVFSFINQFTDVAADNVGGHTHIAWAHFTQGAQKIPDLRALLCSFNFDLLGGNCHATLWLMTNDWDPTKLTYNTQPARSGPSIQLNTISTAGGLGGSNTNSLMIPHPNAYYGIALELNSDSGPNTSVTLFCIGF